MPKDDGYERPNFTVDLIIIRFREKKAELLLIERGGEPFKGRWAFPGGFVNPNEPNIEAACRELEEETTVVRTTENLSFFGVYDTPNADPRGWRVTAVYSAGVSSDTEAVGRDDAKKAEWFEFDKIPALAFDHDLILRDFVKRGKISIDDITHNTRYLTGLPNNETA